VSLTALESRTVVQLPSVGPGLFSALSETKISSVRRSVQKDKLILSTFLNIH